MDSSDEDVLFLTFDTRPVELVQPAGALRDRRPLDRRLRPRGRRSSASSIPRASATSPSCASSTQAARRVRRVPTSGTDFYPAEAWTFTLGVERPQRGLRREPARPARRTSSSSTTPRSPTPRATPSPSISSASAPTATSSSAAASRERRPRPGEIDNWELDADEVNDTWGLGVTSKLRERWTADVQGRWSRSDGFADFTAFPGGLPLAGRPVQQAQDIDNYEDIELLALLGRLDYRINRAGHGGLLLPLRGLHDRQLHPAGPAELPARGAAPQPRPRRLPGEHLRDRAAAGLLIQARDAKQTGEVRERLPRFRAHRQGRRHFAGPATAPAGGSGPPARRGCGPSPAAPAARRADGGNCSG